MRLSGGGGVSEADVDGPWGDLSAPSAHPMETASPRAWTGAEPAGSWEQAAVVAIAVDIE